MTTKTVSIKAFVFMEKGYPTNSAGLTDFYSEQVWAPVVWKCQVDNDSERIFVGEQSVSVEVPADFDPRPEQIKALEAKRKELQAQFSAAVTELNRQISQLRAIEHTEAA